MTRSAFSKPGAFVKNVRERKEMAVAGVHAGASDGETKDCTSTSGDRPKGLLLDFGSVISLSIFESHRSTENILGLPDGSLTWLGPLDPSTDLLWQAMQRDELSERDYWAIRAREVGETIGESNWDIVTMLRRVRHSDPKSVLRPQMVHLIEQARRQGIKVSILTNELELFYGAEFLLGIKSLGYFDAIVDATHNGILKPDPRSYAMAIEAMNLAPREILFVDDQFRNVAGAVKAELQTQHFDLRSIQGQIAAIAARLELA